MLKVSSFKQTDSSRCGPACVKMVLGYYGIMATENQVAKKCNWTFEKGCDNMDMVKALNSYGLKSILQTDCTYEDIQKCIKKKIPVIVDWFTHGVNPSTTIMANGHASVVVGLDNDNIFLIDPEDGKQRSIPRKEFMRVWFDWRGKESEFISKWEDMVVRGMIITKK